MSRIDLRFCTVTLMDGSSHTLDVKIGEGNLTWTEKVNREYYLNKGRLDTVRDGEDVPVELKMDFTWEFLRGDSDVTVEDFLKKRGGASAYTSSAADTCAPYAVDIRVVYDPPCSAEKREEWLFVDFRYEQLDHDIKSASVSVSGKCNVTQPSDTRTAQT